MIKRLIQYIRSRYCRSIPDEYFKGYRRLATTPEEITLEACFNCKHQVAFITWYCDVASAGCQYERCHVKSEISKADYKAGKGRWVGLPKEDSRG